MNFNMTQFIFVWFLVVASACATAQNIKQQCEAIGPGIYSTTSSSGLDVTITTKADAIVIENKFLTSVISEENGYRLETIDKDSTLLATLDEVFSALYPEQVKRINRESCGLFFGKKGHEFYLLPSLDEGEYLLFEYSDIDPPEVYQLEK